jgi:hypothetical protein
MSKSFRLSKLTPSQLKLMHDLAEVIRATGLKCTQDPIVVADLINQKIEDDVIPYESPNRADSDTPSPTPERRRLLRRRLS